MATKATNSLENVYLNHTPESSGGLFLKFEDDKEVRVRLISEPYILRSRFEDKTTHEVTTSKKYAWVVINRADGTAQILQLPAGAYNQIVGLIKDEDYGMPTDYDLKITRKNTNSKYSYQIIGSPKRSATTEDEQALALEIDPKIAIEKDGQPVMTLQAYAEAGNKFPDEGATFDKDGNVVITDLDETKNPLDSL